ncbi:hypothetical protein HNP11_003539 [Tsukamurella ocularis]|nr:SAM-dependent methyltransferase [Tsukamurella ocularis]MCS3789347.1 hypothetical protein [Tsukamurella ocularis]
MNTTPASTPATPSFDMERPNVARLYDYFLGGASYLPVDREVGEAMAVDAPHWALSARMTRTFGRRAVQTMASAGVDQFLDLGSGTTAGGGMHLLARINRPAARMVFVDSEPISYELGRQLIDDDPGAAVIKLDFRDVDAVLDHPVTRGLIDFDRPVGLLLAGGLVFVADDEDPGSIVRRYLELLVPGSMIALAHFSDDSSHPEIRAELNWVRRSYERTGSPLHARSREELLSWLVGTEILEPGFVRTGRWRPEFPLTEAQMRCDYGYVGVGRVV